MAQITYKGFGNRELAAKDLAKAGVEGFSKTLFLEDQPTEVDDKVAEAILNDPDLFGKFEKAESDDANQLDIPTDDKKTAKR